MYFVFDITTIHYRLHFRVLYVYMCTCMRACMSLVWILCVSARARVGVDGHCSVASSYATLHIQLTYKYNDATIRTTLLPIVSIQRDATRRSREVFSLGLFRDLDSTGFEFRVPGSECRLSGTGFRVPGCRLHWKNRLPITRSIHSLNIRLGVSSLCVDYRYKKSCCCWGAVGLEYDDGVHVLAMG